VIYKQSLRTKSLPLPRYDGDTRRKHIRCAEWNSLFALLNFEDITFRMCVCVCVYTDFLLWIRISYRKSFSSHTEHHHRSMSHVPFLWASNIFYVPCSSRPRPRFRWCIASRYRCRWNWRRTKVSECLSARPVRLPTAIRKISVPPIIWLRQSHRRCHRQSPRSRT